jgi:hypothetical protein
MVFEDVLGGLLTLEQTQGVLAPMGSLLGRRSLVFSRVNPTTGLTGACVEGRHVAHLHSCWPQKGANNIYINYFHALQWEKTIDTRNWLAWVIDHLSPKPVRVHKM